MIDNASLGSFQVGKAFERNSNINSMDFSDDGQLLVAASDDDSLVSYSALQGREEQVLFSKTWGVEHVRFTHASTAVLFTPRKNVREQTIRYWSLHENRIFREFAGHTDGITSLSMSSVGDEFLSGSLDGTIRRWDLRTPTCAGLLQTGDVQTNLVTAFDPNGMVFAVGLGHNTIKLYDAKNAGAGPFTTFTPQHRNNLVWRNIEFNSDGKLILLTTTQGIVILDSYSGDLVKHISGNYNQRGYPLVASFSPDGNFVLTGTESGLVHVYDAHKGDLVATWTARSPTPHPVGLVRFNPRFMMAASVSGKSLAFWLPRQ